MLAISNILSPSSQSMKKILILLLLFVSVFSFGQTKDPNALLVSLKKKYLGIRDYTVDASVVVDVWFLNMPVKKAKIYYKYPNKVHVETTGFALLPKRAASFDPSAFIGDKFTAVYMKSEKWGNSVMDVIKTIPNDPNSDLILSTFWIDTKKMEIRKLEINSKSGGSFQVEMEYNNLPFDLPQKLTVSFDVKDMNMPKGMTGEMPPKDNTGKKKGDGKGKVTISYSNYLVNKGLSDKIFEDKK
jgi:outer membrane lipoprotein-sorting protein